MGARGPARLPEEHGTLRGYWQHRGWGRLPACILCLDAWNEYQRDYGKQWRARRKAAQ